MILSDLYVHSLMGDIKKGAVLGGARHKWGGVQGRTQFLVKKTTTFGFCLHSFKKPPKQV